MFFSSAPLSAAVESIDAKVKQLLLSSKRKEAVDLLKKKRAKNEKIKLISEQFLDSANFQMYLDAQAMAAVSYWQQCLKIALQIKQADADNLLVLKLKAKCQKFSNMPSEASKTYHEALHLISTDTEAILGLAETLNILNDYKEALRVLSIDKSKVTMEEAEEIIKIRFDALIGNHQDEDALNLLLSETQPGTRSVIAAYKLGEYYQKKDDGEFSARKYLHLFMSRYKKLQAKSALKKRYQTLYEDAQAKLDAIDRAIENKR